jgi:hypothetical protein
VSFGRRKKGQVLIDQIVGKGSGEDCSFCPGAVRRRTFLLIETLNFSRPRPSAKQNAPSIPLAILQYRQAFISLPILLFPTTHGTKLPFWFWVPYKQGKQLVAESSRSQQLRACTSGVKTCQQGSNGNHGEKDRKVQHYMRP